MLMFLFDFTHKLTIDLQTSLNAEAILFQQITKRNFFIIKLDFSNFGLCIKFKNLVGSLIKFLSAT